MRFGKVFAEFIDIDRLEVFVLFVKHKPLAGDKCLDSVVLTELDAGAVHPALILVHQRERVPRVGDKLLQH